MYLVVPTYFERLQQFAMALDSRCVFDSHRRLKVEGARKLDECLVRLVRIEGVLRSICEGQISEEVRFLEIRPSREPLGDLSSVEVRALVERSADAIEFEIPENCKRIRQIARELGSGHGNVSCVIPVVDVDERDGGDECSKGSSRRHGFLTSGRIENRMLTVDVSKKIPDFLVDPGLWRILDGDDVDGIGFDAGQVA